MIIWKTKTEVER